MKHLTADRFGCGVVYLTGIDTASMAAIPSPKCQISTSSVSPGNTELENLASKRRELDRSNPHKRAKTASPTMPKDTLHHAVYKSEVNSNQFCAQKMAIVYLTCELPCFVMVVIRIKLDKTSTLS